MRNLADLQELCELIVEYADIGSPVKDAIEQSPYTTDELIYELALDFLAGAK